MGEIHLSDAEWEIMNCLWNKPNQKISEIVIALSDNTFEPDGEKGSSVI